MEKKVGAIYRGKRVENKNRGIFFLSFRIVRNTKQTASVKKILKNKKTKKKSLRRDMINM